MGKAYLSCDMEGCSGIVAYQFCNPEGQFYPEGRAYMTADVKAAIQGLNDAGADDIVVNDAHWNMTNLRVQDLPPGVTLISGGAKTDSMTEGLDDTFEAVLLVGYHPRWGVPRGVLAHTYSGDIAEVRLNNQPVGEAGLAAGLAGYYEVPVIFVSGDDRLRAEVRELDPAIRFAVTKQGIGRGAARLIHPEHVHLAITEQAKQAWKQRKEIAPVTFPAPIELSVTFKDTRMADLCLRMPGVVREDNLTVAYSHEDYRTVYRAFLAMLSMAGSVPAPRG